uniref:Potassium channel domain-containing protein n=2 Tax=Meloidogyne enterolobii TaxID=390850 RepID=A0A6V7UYY1_MELEN|nr:unnamed protein product [Meloidogyne enterolobii]
MNEANITIIIDEEENENNKNEEESIQENTQLQQQIVEDNTKINKNNKKYFWKNRRNNPLVTVWRPVNEWANRGRETIARLAVITQGTNYLSKPRLPKVSRRAENQIRNFGPLLLLLSLFVYLILGASAFLFFEHTNHEIMVRKFFFNLIINRNKFSRQISSAIFNGTRNMLIIVDYDSSERIQREIVNLLSLYEQQLELKMPDLNEWTLENSLTYCWGLITTIGHGHRSPKTGGGQVFALLYCVLGVPFFVFTLIVISYRLLNLCRVLSQLVTKNKHFSSSTFDHRTLLLFFVCIIYCSWLIIFALILYWFAIPESFWRSLYAAVLSSLTIQSADYNLLNEKQKLITLSGSSISLLFSCICIITITGVWQDSSSERRKNKKIKVETNKSEEEEEGIGSENGKKITKYNIIIDETGNAKLNNNPSIEYSLTENNLE